MKQSLRWLAAVILLAAAVPLAPEVAFPVSLAELLQDAERKLDWQYFEEAERSYQEILRRFPEQTGIHEALGVICLMQHKYSESIAHLEQELALNPGNHLAELLAAAALCQSGDVVAAEAWIARAADSQAAMNKRQPAKKFMLDNPGLIPFVKGILHKERGEWGKASSMMAQAAEQKYSAAELAVHWVDLHLQRGDEAAAVAALAGLELRNSQLAEPLREIVRTRDRQEARAYARSRPLIIRYFKEPIPLIVHELNTMAQNAVKQANPQGAIKTWKKALLADESRFDIHYNLALIYCLYGFQREALPHCLRAVELGDDRYQTWALNLAGNIQFERGQYRQAIHYYQQAIELDANYLKCRNNLAAAFWESGQLQCAEREWQKVIQDSGRMEKGPDAREVFEGETIRAFVSVRERHEAIEAGKSLAQLYIIQKQTEKALLQLQMVLRLVPTDADAHWDLGRLYIQTGDQELARAHLAAAIHNGSRHEAEARKLLAELGKAK